MEDEDTIELVLTPAEMAALTRAAAGDALPARPVLAAPVLVPPREPAPARPRTFDRQLRAIRVPAFIGIAVFAISLASIKYVAMSREQDVPLPPAPAAAPTAVTAAAAPAPTPTDTAPAPSPIRFTNPFDSSEVFDFPAGTSEDEARAAVAEMLLERARTRVAAFR